MKTVFTPVPAAPGFAALLDVRGLQPSNVLCKLSENLGPADQVSVFGSLDSTAAPGSPNLTPLGSTFGNQGDPGTQLPLAGWPFLLAQRTAGGAPGTFFVSGTTAPGSLTAPGTVALPVVNSGPASFSAGINLANFAGFSILVGLDKNATAADVFNVYGTDDPAFVGTAGGELLGQIKGGSSITSGTIPVTDFQFVYVQRFSGVTPGNLLAWGAEDTASGGIGPLNLGSLAVGNTAVSGNFGTPPLTAAQSVDVYSSFVLMQTTGGGGVNVTLPSPTSPVAGKIVFVSSQTVAGAQPVEMYGAALFPGFGMSFQWDGTEWTPVGVGNAATTSGNFPGAPMTLGSLDGSDVTLQAIGGGAGTGNLFLEGFTNVSVTSTSGSASLIAQSLAAGEGNVFITASSPGGSGLVFITGQGGVTIIATTGSASLTAPAGTAGVEGQTGVSIVSLGGPASMIGQTNVNLQAFTGNIGIDAVVGNISLTGTDFILIPVIGALVTPSLEFLTLGGANSLAFRAPNAVAANVTWILPPADGTAGQALLTDGAGNLHFGAPSGAALDFFFAWSISPLGSTVAIDAPFQFGSTGNGAAGSNQQFGGTSITKTGPGTFTLVAGTYAVDFQGSFNEPGQISALLNGVLLPQTETGRATGTNYLVGSWIIVVPPGPAQTFEVHNHSSAAALTLTPLPGGTVAQAMSIRFLRIA